MSDAQKAMRLALDYLQARVEFTHVLQWGIDQQVMTILSVGLGSFWPCVTSRSFMAWR